MILFRKFIAGLLILASFAAHAHVAPACAMSFDQDGALPCWLILQLAPCASDVEKPCCTAAVLDDVTLQQGITVEVMALSTTPTFDELLIQLPAFAVLQRAAIPRPRFSRSYDVSIAGQSNRRRFLQTARLRL